MEKDVQIIIRKLQAADDWHQRREAIIELGYHKGTFKEQSFVLNVLMEQLRDPMPEIIQAAAISLGRLGTFEAIEELSRPRVLNSSDMRVRWAAVSALGSLGDFRIIDTLVPIIDDSEWLVRNEAFNAIKKKVTEIVELGDNRLARILLRMLALEDEEIVELAREGLSQLGARSRDLIIEALASQNEAVRSNAVMVLGEMKYSESLPYVIGALSDSSRQVRCSAAFTLGEMGHSEAIEPLVTALTDSSDLVQDAASDALIKFDNLATKPLLNALGHEINMHSIRAIILTLGKIADESALPLLVQYLRNSYSLVRVATILALKPFGTKVLPYLIELLSVNNSDIESLILDASNAENPATQIRAIKALGSLEDHRSTWLLKLLEIGDDSEVSLAAQKALVQIGCAAWGRCGALTLLGEIGAEEVFPYLINSLHDDSSNVRIEAAKALGKFGGGKVLKPLAKTVATDEDPYMRAEALKTLRWLGITSKIVIDAGLESLNDSSWEVRNHAARLLGNFQENRSIAPLIKTLSDENWRVRQSAEDALQNFGKKAVPALIETLKSNDWVVRLRVSRALGEIGDTRAIAPLEKIISKEVHHPQAKNIEQLALNKIKNNS